MRGESGAIRAKDTCLATVPRTGQAGTCAAEPCWERESKPTAGPRTERAGKCVMGPCKEQEVKLAAGSCMERGIRCTAEP